MAKDIFDNNDYEILGENIQNSYLLDRNLNIIDLHPNWDLFVYENSGDKKFLKSSILGRNIFEFIKGDSVRMWFESLITLVKFSNRSITRNYSCDSPDVKRFMKMRITPQEGGQIKFDHYIISLTKIPIKAKMHFYNNAENIITRCSVCNRFLYHEKWQEIELVANLIDLSRVSIVDIVCGDCIKINY
ncbi:MAG: hypothetical protein ACP5LO_04500 [Calditerrivibrio sp.]|uniref:hypothetical protein n=1 Tax=Calditerrivibrio sp. TaxID=2792612 RepID=UPI003D098027